MCVCTVVNIGHIFKLNIYNYYIPANRSRREVGISENYFITMSHPTQNTK